MQSKFENNSIQQTGRVKNFGELAMDYMHIRLPLMVLRSAAGYYLGTANDCGPVSRESLEYWATEEAATRALNGIKDEDWTQRATC
jgi:hypothetical protein